MRISEAEQNCRDFDWYCVDGEGCIGHFASAGFKQLPPSVVESSEDLNLLDGFFHGLPIVCGAHELDENLNAEQRTPRYLESFVAMADRGLFSFDIESYLQPGICYFRVAIPQTPIRVVDLPERIREVIGRTTLQSLSLARCSRIPYSMTISM